jgi:hypothetical protein
MEVTAAVTSGWHHAGSTVLDKRGQIRACSSAAKLAALVDQANSDTGSFGLVAQGLEQVGSAPLPQPEVLHPTGVMVGDAGQVADRQHADRVADGKGDDLAGGLMVGVVDPATVPGLDPALLRPIASPAAGAALPSPGSSSGCLRLASLPIAQVQKALRPDCPARHQQGCLLGDKSIGMDDAQIYPCHPTGVQLVRLDGDGGGDGQPEVSSIGHQGDRPDLSGQIRDGAGQAQPPCRAALGDRQPHPAAV